MSPVRRWIRELHQLRAEDAPLVGGKAANLAELIAAGLPVPPGFVITTDGYRSRDGAEGPPADLVAEVLSAYRDLDPGGSLPVAVRSSATAEDLAEASFAGQQESYLNVVGEQDLLVAVQECWASLQSERAQEYRRQQRVAEDGLALAVIVQQLVDADAAGVMFTADPTTGRRDVVMISAAWGLGEAVVAGLVEGDRVVVPEQGPVLIEPADQSIMVVRTDHRTAARPVPPERRGRPVLEIAQARQLAELGRRAEAHFGRPQDLEWARAQDRLWVLQSRPVTALPPPEGPVPGDWTVPDPRCWYFRASIVEQLPDPLSPLFAELIDGSVSRSLQRLMRELTGRAIVQPGDVGLPTINGYAYYAYRKRGMIKVTLNSWRAFGVLLQQGRRSGARRWQQTEHPAYAATVARWQPRDLTALTDQDLLAGVVELLDAATRYYTAVQTIIPVAASSEVMFTRFYDAVVRRRGDPPATTVLLGEDSAPIRAEKALWELARWAGEQPELAAWLRRCPAGRIVDRMAEADLAPDDVPAAAWSQWGERLAAHLQRWGHTVYNLDFVHPVPAERPEPVLDTLRYYLGDVEPPAGADPYARQRDQRTLRAAVETSVEARLDPVRRAVFGRLLRAARASGPLREDALADVGLAWPVVRRLLAELGRRLVAAGTVSDPDAVCWLTSREIVARGDAPESRDELVQQRQARWRGQRRAQPPQVLPRTRVTALFDAFMPARAGEQSGTLLRGLGASGGRVQGTVRVLDGPQDFTAFRPGEILVSRITTPAWTTLFARAAGVVTDVGGPLSHSSIVAREYGIPAVLGTGVATRRLHTGDRVTLDGDAGTVEVCRPAG